MIELTGQCILVNSAGKMQREQLRISKDGLFHPWVSSKITNKKCMSMYRRALKPQNLNRPPTHNYFLRINFLSLFYLKDGRSFTWVASLFQSMLPETAPTQSASSSRVHCGVGVGAAQRSLAKIPPQQRKQQRTTSASGCKVMALISLVIQWLPLHGPLCVSTLIRSCLSHHSHSLV